MGHFNPNLPLNSAFEAPGKISVAKAVLAKMGRASASEKLLGAFERDQGMNGMEG